MIVVYDMVPAIIFILNSFELSSQFECLPNGAPIPGGPPGDPSSPNPDRKHPLDRPYPSRRSSPHDEPPLRLRSRSPPAVNRNSVTGLPFSNVLGYELDQLTQLRLIPYKNPQREFELRRYTFPTDKPVQILKAPKQYGCIPTQEQIVLSTFDGDIFAIFEGADTLAGIYTYNSSVYCRMRAKINMMNGQVTQLTIDEIKETPVGRNRQFWHGYRVDNLSQNHINQNFSAGSLTPAESQLASRSSSSPGHMALPTRLSSSDGSGYELHQLQYMQIIPKNIPSQTFKLQKYTFPADKLILLHDIPNSYRPIPIQQLIVLTTDAGDVFAILKSDNDLAGIYAYIARSRANARVKINMRSGMVTKLTKYEMMTVPVGGHRTLSHNFNIQHMSHNSSRHTID